MKKLRETMIELADDYTALDVLNMLSMVYGMRVSQTQIKFADECDDAIVEMRQRMERWKKENGKVFTADDFPDFLKEHLAENDVDPNQMVVDAFNGLYSTATVRKDYVIILGKAYFNLDGYSFVISRSIGKYIDRDIAKRMAFEVFEPFAEE